MPMKIRTKLGRGLHGVFLHANLPSGERAFDFDLVFDFGFWGQGVSPCRISELTPTGEMKKYSRSLYFMKNR